MAQGIQIFDPSGNLLLDVSDYTLKLFGVINISPAANGSQVVSALIGQSNVFTIFNADSQGGSQADPTISVNTATGTISWTYDPTALSSGGTSTGAIFYGVN